MAASRKSPWKLLYNHPPAYVRLCARRKVSGKTVRALSLPEIAIASGLPLARVQAISQSMSWEGITIPEAERFCKGCNFDPLNAADRNRQSAYRRSCKNQPYTYLKKHRHWVPELRPLIQSLRLQRAS